MCDGIIKAVGGLVTNVIGAVTGGAPKAPSVEPPERAQPAKQPGGVQGRGRTADRGGGFGFGQVNNTLLTGSGGAQAQSGQLGGTRLLGG